MQVSSSLSENSPRRHERRLKYINGFWRKPKHMFTLFAGEASIDKDRNVHYTHHFYKDNVMLEADFNFARRR